MDILQARDKMLYIAQCIHSNKTNCTKIIWGGGVLSVNLGINQLMSPKEAGNIAAARLEELG